MPNPRHRAQASGPQLWPARASAHTKPKGTAATAAFCPPNLADWHQWARGCFLTRRLLSTGLCLDTCVARNHQSGNGQPGSRTRKGPSPLRGLLTHNTGSDEKDKRFLRFCGDRTQRWNELMLHKQSFLNTCSRPAVPSGAAPWPPSRGTGEAGDLLAAHQGWPHCADVDVTVMPSRKLTFLPFCLSI